MGDGSRLARQARAILHEADTFAAAEFLHQQGPPDAVLDGCHALLHDCGASDRLPEGTLLAAAAALQYGLDESHRLARQDIPAALRLRDRVRLLAADLGRCAWPDVGDAATTAAGREAARLALRLTLELDCGDAAMSRAHRLVGRHWLVVRAWRAARHHLGLAAHYAQRAGLAGEAALAQGLAALVDEQLNPGDRAAHTAVAAARQTLDAPGADPYLAHELHTAAALLRRDGLDFPPASD